jgi:hypothetical protein
MRAPLSRLESNDTSKPAAAASRAAIAMQTKSPGKARAFQQSARLLA